MSFDKKLHIKNMQPVIQKFVAHLDKSGIEFSPEDEDSNLENVILTSGKKVIKISHHSFYRFSGICCITKDGKEKNSIEEVPVTDEMYMMNFMRPIVDALFKYK